MVHFNSIRKEVSYKIIYYGAASSGKTSNLKYICDNSAHTKGRKISSVAVGKEKLFFDFLPIIVKDINGFQINFQLFSVPSSDEYASVRKLIIQDVDGIVLVADSTKMEENVKTLESLEQTLGEHKLKLEEIALVIQWNKRDISSSYNLNDLQKINQRKVPEIASVATTGDGVFSTIETLANMLIESTIQKYPDGFSNIDGEKKTISFAPKEAKEIKNKKKAEAKKLATERLEKFSVEKEHTEGPAGDVIILKLSGRIEQKNWQLLKTEVEKCYSGRNFRIILDFQNVEYLHSAAFGMLIEIANRAKMIGGGIRLIHVKAKIKIFFEMMCVESFLPIMESQEKALESFPISDEEIHGSRIESVRKSKAPATLTATQSIRLTEYSDADTEQKKIFICYSPKDEKLAKLIEQDLQLKSWQVWRDRCRMESDVSWSREVSQPLVNSDILLMLWTKNAVENQWVRNEWVSALALKKQIVPFAQPDHFTLPLPLQTLSPVSYENYRSGNLNLREVFGKALAVDWKPFLPIRSSIPISPRRMQCFSPSIAGILS